MHTKTGHSLWPPLCGGLTLALAALLVVVLTSDGDSTSAAPAPGTTSTTAAPAPAVTAESRVPRPGGPVFGDSPTGCLAGTSVDADMVLATQAHAPHTPYGAVELAASLMRWGHRYPFPDAAQIKTIEDSVFSPSMLASKTNLTDTYARIASDSQWQKNVPPGPAEFGTHYTVSTRPGKFLIDSTSTTDRVTVHMTLGVVINGEVSEETYALGSPVLAWEGGAWRQVDAVRLDTSEQLRADGTPFAGGC